MAGTQEVRCAKIVVKVSYKAKKQQNKRSLLLSLSLNRRVGKHALQDRRHMASPANQWSLTSLSSVRHIMFFERIRITPRSFKLFDHKKYGGEGRKRQSQMHVDIYVCYRKVCNNDWGNRKVYQWQVSNSSTIHHDGAWWTRNGNSSRDDTTHPSPIRSVIDPSRRWSFI